MEKVTNRNNFCRVFELPEEYPEGLCFGGGYPVIFQMVDWFNPVPDPEIEPEIDGKNVSEMGWPEIVELLKDFLKDKRYVKPGRKYIVITDFGESFLFSK